MASAITNAIAKQSLRNLEERFLMLSLCSSTNVQVRHKKYPNTPRLRHPTWLTKKNRVIHDDYVTQENTEFIKEVVKDRYIDRETPLQKDLLSNSVEWMPSLKRPGLIARKIGIYPIWLKNGKKMFTTLLQVLDNHVIKYYPPEEYDPPRKRSTLVVNKKGCLLIGAEAADPALLTKEFCGIFKDSGVIPKRILSRFFVSPEAALPPGTPLSALHFQVGNYVDVRGKTIDRGFQGVVKRHGFKGMPASHGVTKTHRRGGNIGGGGEKGRVWPGTKMPGHMGNRYRILKGLRVWRINTKYNVLYVSGQNVPGETNSIVTIYDTILPLRQPTNPLPFPTLLSQDTADLPEDIYHDEIHRFDEPSILYDEK